MIGQTVVYLVRMSRNRVKEKCSPNGGSRFSITRRWTDGHAALRKQCPRRADGHEAQQKWVWCSRWTDWRRTVEREAAGKDPAERARQRGPGRERRGKRYKGQEPERGPGRQGCSAYGGLQVITRFPKILGLKRRWVDSESGLDDRVIAKHSIGNKTDAPNKVRN